MHFKKPVLGVVILFAFVLSESALERKKPLPLKELQNPNGPSYVPVPYPKTRNEIIEDIKYAIKTHHGAIDEKYLQKGDEILSRLLLENPSLKVAEIEKVTNNSIDIPDEFLFLVVLRDNDGNETARLSLEASGLYFGGMIVTKKDSKNSFTTKLAVLKEFSTILDKYKIKKMERVFMASIIAPYPYAPAWEITALDNSKYYFDANQQIFKLKEEIENVKEKGMNANNITHSKDEIITYDSINNKFLLFVRIK